MILFFASLVSVIGMTNSRRLDYCLDDIIFPVNQCVAPSVKQTVLCPFWRFKWRLRRDLCAFFFCWKMTVKQRETGKDPKSKDGNTNNDAIVKFMTCVWLEIVNARHFRQLACSFSSNLLCLCRVLYTLNVWILRKDNHRRRETVQRLEWMLLLLVCITLAVSA